MLAEFTVELGPDDPGLEIPWASEDGRLRFLDLKRQPELLLEIPEACSNRELADFLVWANSEESVFETAKCDLWSGSDITVDEEVFGEPQKFGSYVDLILTDATKRGDFGVVEAFARDTALLLRKAPDMPASAELVVRRCVDHRARSSSDGFYFTLYLTGYGSEEEEARGRWAIALKLVQHALIQFSAGAGPLFTRRTANQV
jgi:hypothetical protein